MALVKKLTRIGNSSGIILPSEVIKIAGLEPGGECEIDVEKGKVIVKPYKKINLEDARVMTAMARFIKKYRYDLKKLAS